MTRTWVGRPRTAAALRVGVGAIPVVVAVSAAALASRVPAPSLVRIVAVLLTALVVHALLDRAARRLLPLAALLQLSLLFPDAAPSRFRIALRAGSTRDLRAAALRPRPAGEAAAAERVLELLGALARHDRPTRRHSERVRAYTDLLAEALALPTADRERLRWAALLHDLGKVTLDPAVLGKPLALSDDEWVAVRRHPAEGAALAEGLRPFLGDWFDTIGQHHERWDGSGYPQGLAGAQICRGARIVAVADSFEVMTAGRSYRGALDPAVAREELVRCGGSQFDPAVVRALLDVSLGRAGRWGRGAALVAAVPFAGDPVGLHHGSALHPGAHAHVTAAPTGHDAGGSAQLTGHGHAAAPAAGADQR